MPSRASSRMLTWSTLMGDRQELPVVQHRYDVRGVEPRGDLDVLGEAGLGQLDAASARAQRGGERRLDDPEGVRGQPGLGREVAVVEQGQDRAGAPEVLGGR